MIRIWDEESLREYDYRTVEEAVAAYVDDMESEGGALSDRFDVVVQSSGEDWARYTIRTEMVRQITVDRGVRVEDPTARSGANNE